MTRTVAPTLPNTLSSRFPDVEPVNAVRAEIVDHVRAVDTLIPHPDNPRSGNADDIAASLWRYGQYKPIVVQRSTNRILAGNHTWQAAKLLGWDKIGAVEVDVDDDTAARILVADNRLSDLSAYNDSALVDLLKSMSDLQGTGYTENDLDAIVAHMTPGLPEGFKEVDVDDPMSSTPTPETLTCPSCGYMITRDA